METKDEKSTTEVQVIQEAEQLKVYAQPKDLNLFANKEAFEHTQRVAKMLSQSDLVPKQFQNNIGNCIIALEMAIRIGSSPLMTMQNLYVVHGKPAWSSSFLIATINASGKFSPLRYEGNVKDGIKAWAYDKQTKERLEGVLVTMEMAKGEGWSTKSGSKWVTMPELMMRYRAATFFARQFAPELSMGIQTQEEIQDIPHQDLSVDQLEELKTLFELKQESLDLVEKADVADIIKNKEVRNYQKAVTLLKSK